MVDALVSCLREQGAATVRPVGQEGAHHESGDLVRHAGTVRPGADEALTRHVSLVESVRPMKMLHTADWHVGKTIKGQSRLAEHRAVLADIVRIADTETVDVVLIAGDLYETAAPTPDAEALVLKTLLDLRDTGAHVIVISGNHDNAPRFEAVRPLFAALGVVVMGAPRRPADGGVVEVVGRSGDSVRVALVPFLSQRGIIRTEQLMGQDAGQNVATYDERMRQMVGALCTPFADDAVNVVAAHCMVMGASLGGGERSAQTYMDYAVGAVAFPHTRTTSRSGTSIARSRSPAPRRSGTRARRCRSTSARSKGRTACCS